MANPQILVVMPFYNARPYIRRAVQSILEQTYRSYTLLLINDGSTDGSEYEVTRIDDHRIIIWEQQNQGPGVAMNRAIQYAIKEDIPFIARMDADDISLPERLQLQISLLENYPLAATCSANCFYIEQDSERVIGSSTVSAIPFLIRLEIIYGLRGLIQGASVFRTSALASIGGYRSEFKSAEEVDLYLRLIEKYEVRNCKEFLYKIRMHPGSLSLGNVKQNILYHIFALDCAKKRRSGRPELSFNAFLQSMNCRVKYKIWREEYLLNSWRKHINSGGISHLVLAALLDPRRIAFRVLRYLGNYWYQ